MSSVLSIIYAIQLEKSNPRIPRKIWIITEKHQFLSKPAVYSHAFHFYLSPFTAATVSRPQSGRTRRECGRVESIDPASEGSLLFQRYGSGSQRDRLAALRLRTGCRVASEGPARHTNAQKTDCKRPPWRDGHAKNRSTQMERLKMLLTQKT